MKTSKSYDELLQGFVEIQKIQSNQEVFEKRGADLAFEIIKKDINNRESPEG